MLCRGDHAETIQIEFDENQVNYEALLDVFWKNHNPAAVTKRQYMSAIFYNNEEQKSMAEKSLQAMRERFKPKTIRTEILPAEKFYDAEE